jgi:hypothetical protein
MLALEEKVAKAAVADARAQLLPTLRRWHAKAKGRVRSMLADEIKRLRRALGVTPDERRAQTRERVRRFRERKATPVKAPEPTHRKATKPKRDNDAFWREQDRTWRAMWKAEGRSIADYTAGLRDDDSEVWQWRRAKGAESVERMQRDWLADHPGQTADDFERVTSCGATNDEVKAWETWLRPRMRP